LANIGEETTIDDSFVEDIVVVDNDDAGVPDDDDPISVVIFSFS